MNMKLVGVVLSVSGLGLVACSDSTGTTGSGGGGTGGGTTTTTTSAGGGGTGGATCESENPAGYEKAAGLVISSCGCDVAGAGGGGGGTPSACSTECAADPAPCMDPPGDPAGACGTCIQGKADAQDACALSAATGAECQGDTAPGGCADYITCVLSS